MKVYSLETNSIVERKWFLDLLTCMFGVGAWILVNSLYTQLPLLVQSAPEGWNLPSYLSIAIQIGNVGPLLYSAWRRKYGNRYDRPLTIAVLISGVTSVLLLAGLYDVTGVVFGQPHSVVLCALTFTMALVGCTSSVLFIPSLSRYPDIYLVTYMVGEGISGFVPSLVAIVQGVGTTTCRTVELPDGRTSEVKSTTDALFSSGPFFIGIGVIMCASTVSYLCLEYLPTCKREKIRIPSEDDQLRRNIGVGSTENRSHSLNVSLLAVQGAIVFFANGLLPSIQSFSCLPYGYMAYHFATNLSNIANPVACFIAYYTSRTSKTVIYMLCSICVVSTMYMLMTAFTSPSPPLRNSITGTILIVFMWVLFFGCASYVKLSIAAVLRNEGNRGLYLYGCITQIGSLSGALIGFYLINILQLLKSYEPC
ncbi:solute carrier family 52, riboflavin transporter, member 3-A isoform X2 [Aphis gossypii]|nr:solute carrier family 52, riboflavin transporter, member 3-A isoform X2 [Aphis gossypii]XP_027844423.1 solute carrier family 52, riboflavin transporter, member 3-A isoform X2 [Aphis gossypii]XP_027844424.1 solute carrier family 52, riboflavin transporter, member 3-A isoform X2 [Aphis gossypii]XP_050060829.1 solute carrier family 52, riboflavin transporter, member 3-A isoform X2 [Aphis gossypii]XP_050060830.1 solute carrier family 52, riboflavin transporter, member 3-A isoform X2 [Aphis gossy